jgi:hypothetical protein
MPSQAETIAALQGLSPVTTPQSPADPYAAIRSHGSAIGLPDAIRALSAGAQYLAPGLTKYLTTKPPPVSMQPTKEGKLLPSDYNPYAAGAQADVANILSMLADPTHGAGAGLLAGKAMLGMGLLPAAKAATKTMGELLPHLYPEASSFAKMTPKEYLGMFGSDLPKQLPQDVENVLKPYMQAPPKVGKVPGPGPVQQFAPSSSGPAAKSYPADALAAMQAAGLSPGKSMNTPMSPQELVEMGKSAGSDLSQANIDKYLAKHPGASIMDIANTHVGGPSMPLNKAYQTIKPDVDLDVPREGGIPYTPLAAKILGRSENLVHGTRLGSGAWSTPSGPGSAMGTTLDALRLPDDELGVHFGNPKQAQVFTGERLETGYAPRTYPVVVQANNPLRMKDLGSWGADRVLDELARLNGIGGTKGQFPDTYKVPGDMNSIRQYISDKGYDSVVYKNTEEDPGHDSFIKFTPSPEATNFVTGVRSPFAAFDPSKIMRPELAAGLAGGTLAAPAIDPNLLKALTGNQTDQQQ